MKKLTYSILLFLLVGISVWLLHMLVSLFLPEVGLINYESTISIVDLIIILIASVILSFFYNNSIESKRKQIQELNKYKLLTENANDFICLFDPKGNIVYLNKYARELLELPKDNKIKLNISEIFTETINPEFRKRTENTFFPDDNSKPFSITVTSINGKQIELEVNVIKYLDENKLYYLMVARDISETIKYITKIKHLNGLLKTIQNIQQIAYTEKQMSGIINRTVIELTKDRGYLFSWILLIDESNNIISYAESGLGKKFDEFLEHINQNGITGDILSAIAHKQIQFPDKNNDNCIDCPLFEFDHNGRTMMIALNHNDLVFGVISATLSKDYYVNKEEYELFKNIASEISLALHNLKIENEKNEIANRYRFQLEFAMDAIILAYADTGIVVDCNKAAEVLFNTTKNKIIGRHQTQLHPDDSTDYSLVFKEHLSKSKGQIIETKIISDDGIIKEVAIKASDFFVNNKRYIQGIFRDISESEKTKNELNNIFNMSMDLIGTAKLSEAKFIKINTAFEKILGYSEEEILSKSFLDLIHPDDIKPTINIIDDKLLKNEKVFHFENRYRKKDGTYIWLDWVANPYPKEDIFFAVAHDITSRKLREKELYESRLIIEKEKDYNKQLLSALPDMIFVINKKGFIIDYHSNSRDLLYRKPEEFLDRKIDDVLPPDIVNLIYVKMNLVLANKKNEMFSYSLLSNNKTLFYESRMVAVDDYHILSIVRDITELKHNQSELTKAKEKAEQSDRLKSAFLANMSHELRTPINGVMGFAQIMQEGGFTTEEVIEYANIIFSSSNHLLNLINDIVDISKIESNLMGIYNINFDLNFLMDELHFLFNGIIKNKYKDVKLILSKDVPKEFFINSDDTKIKQILNNLLSNSVKFTKHGYIRFGYKLQANNKILFYVKDDGIGIPSEQQKAVFERFIQVERSDGVVYGGTGLGLSISKACVEMLDGEIWLNSQTENGTDFYFTITYNPEDIDDKSLYSE